ncbi:hypothetical protein CsSME_00002545 [Camellia sinensis var. sinensis]
MVGSEVAGSGGRLTLGTVGMVGSVGFGKDDGIWVVGKGGNVGIGKLGIVGIVGKCILANRGNVVWGKVGITGSGGSVTFGRDGIVGIVWSTFRAAKLIWMLENESIKIRDRTKLVRKAAICL